MKLLFNYEGKPEQKPFNHSILVRFPNIENGISFLGRPYKTLESWFEAVRRQLLAMGISNFQYSYPPKKNDKDPLEINFLFKKELDQLQFWALICDDQKGVFERIISSETILRSKVRLNNVQSFLYANDIPNQIVVKDGFNFKIVTYSRLDDLAVATNFANGAFNKGLENILSRDRPLLLTKY